MRVNLEQDEDVGVQMAPLIDCVFLLLIFFLVATTLKKIEKELPLDIPVVSEVAEPRQVVDDMTVISIDRAGGLYLGGEPVGQGFLERKLREIAQSDPGRRIRIDGDTDAPWGAGVQVAAMCKIAGLTNVGLKVESPEDVQRTLP